MVTSHCRASRAPDAASAAWIRALDAWLNEMDISPPHFDAWKPHQAVTTAVIERRTTVATSRRRVQWGRSGFSVIVIVIVLVGQAPGRGSVRAHRRMAV
ncbi:hypothetical protein QP157_14590 [Sphingomonas sp. LR61]|uniref:hypothetical protein n=1 Tax=Sphingomonas sp. LR61 TaxID=3050234 RepID=UPI002FE0E166